MITKRDILFFAQVFLIFILVIASTVVYYKCDDMKNISLQKELDGNKIAKDKKLIEKHMQYLKLHSKGITMKNMEQIKNEISIIAELSGVKDVILKSTVDEDLFKNLVLHVSSNTEESIYQFIYFIENVLSGVVIFKVLSIEKDKNDVFLAKINIDINFFNIEFNKNFLCNQQCIENEECVNGLKNEIYKNCAFKFFNEKSVKITLKLNGIIGYYAYVNGKKYKLGDIIGDFKIVTINQDNIIVEDEKKSRKRIDLGKVF